MHFSKFRMAINVTLIGLLIVAGAILDGAPASAQMLAPSTGQLSPRAPTHQSMSLQVVPSMVDEIAKQTLAVVSSKPKYWTLTTGKYASGYCMSGKTKVFYFFLKVTSGSANLTFDPSTCKLTVTTNVGYTYLYMRLYQYRSQNQVQTVDAANVNNLTFYDYSERLYWPVQDAGSGSMVDYTTVEVPADKGWYKITATLLYPSGDEPPDPSTFEYYLE